MLPLSLLCYLSSKVSIGGIAFNLFRGLRVSTLTCELNLAFDFAFAFLEVSHLIELLRLLLPDKVVLNLLSKATIDVFWGSCCFDVLTELRDRLLLDLLAREE